MGIRRYINWKKRWRKPGDEKYTDVPVLYNDRVASDFERNVSAEDRGAAEECTYFYDLSDFRVAKADFLRLRSVGLSYIMPEKLLKGMGISSMMIRFQASNLFVWAHKDWKHSRTSFPDRQRRYHTGQPWTLLLQEIYQRP